VRTNCPSVVNVALAVADNEGHEPVPSSGALADVSAPKPTAKQESSTMTHVQAAPRRSQTALQHGS
jgi:hypothetical protein